MQEPRKSRRPQTGGAPIANPKPTDEVVWEDICKELTEYFNSSEVTAHAKAAFSRLVDAHCRKEIILQNLYLFCGGNREHIKAVRKTLNFKGRRKRMLAIAALLEKVPSEIEVAEQLLHDLNANHNMKPDCPSISAYANLLNRV